MGRLVAYPDCHPPGPNPISKWGFCITRFWFPFRRPHAGSKSKRLKPETSTLRPGNLPEKPRPSLKGSSYTRRVHAAQPTPGPPPRYLPCARAAELGRQAKGKPRRWRLSLPGLLGPCLSVPRSGPPPSRSPPAARTVSAARTAATRAALSLGPARHGRAPVGGGRAAPEAPRPPPAPSPGAPARRLGRFLSPSAGGERSSCGGVTRAQLRRRRSRRSRPSWFRSIVGWLTQSAPTWPRLAPSPPGAPRPRGSGPAGLETGSGPRGAGAAERACPGAEMGKKGITLTGGRCL